ncbi:hypothetical protein EV586_101920 [Tumebacillus sp. BK434]|nr:hypothetical protein [Tumebacillus sp. BK434]TCP59687.1 hypothetical protein EV586_101920 [Tumebacillus sp. BK434]
MFSSAEIFFNLIWLALLLLGTMITVYILRKSDPFDDGPSVEDETEEV